MKKWTKIGAIVGGIFGLLIAVVLVAGCVEELPNNETVMPSPTLSPTPSPTPTPTLPPTPPPTLPPTPSPTPTSTSTRTQSSVPSAGLEVILSISNAPALNETAELRCTIITFVYDASNVTAQIKLPEGLILVDGNLNWAGDIIVPEEEKLKHPRPNRSDPEYARLLEEYEYPEGKVELSAVVKSVEIGNWTINAIAWYDVFNTEGIQSARRGGSDYVYVAVRENTAWISETLFTTEGPAPARQLNVTPPLPSVEPPSENIITPEPVKPPSMPLFSQKINLSISNAPALNQTAELTCEMLIESTNTTTEIELPEGFELVSGNLTWKDGGGSVTVKAVKTGNWTVTAAAEHYVVTENGTLCHDWGSVDRVYIAVREDTAWISETPFIEIPPLPPGPVIVEPRVNVTPEFPPFVDFNVTKKVITPVAVTPPPGYKKELNKTVKPPVAPTESTFAYSETKRLKNETINLSAVKTQSNDLIDVRQNATTGARSTIAIFSEDFEGAFPGDNWAVGDSNPDSGTDYWDDTSYRSYGGSWSGYCADIGDTGANHEYDNNMYAFMIRNFSIDASDWSSATLSYYTWYKTENGYDYLRVIVTGDGGSNWDEIGDEFDGDGGRWGYHSISVPAEYLTSQFNIGFLFYSDSSVTYEGAYVDDIELEAEVPGELTITGQWWCWISENTFTGGMRADVEVPLVWGQVWIWDGNNNFLGGELTGTDGRFSITVTNPGATGFYVQTLPSSSACHVIKEDSSEFSSYTTQLWYPLPSDTTCDIGDWIIFDALDYRSAWRIYETIANDAYDRGAWDFLVNEGPGYTPPEVTVRFPADDTYYDVWGSHEIRIKDENHTKALDAVQHEYGHFIMHMVYNLYWPSTNYSGPRHFINFVSEPNFAWIEGWANFFPISVQVEPNFEWGDGNYENLETQTWGSPGWDDGDGVEGRVAGVLYDIFDSVDDGYDTFTDGFLNIWDVVYHQTDDNFAEFYTAWRDRGHDVPNANAAIFQNTIDYNNPPSCTIISPSGGGWYSETITVSASASDDTGGYIDGTISQVEFEYYDWTWHNIGADISSSGGWSIDWDTGTLTNSTVWVIAKARDNLGEESGWDFCDYSFGVDNTDPGGWQDFNPSDWTNDRTPDCMVEVEDDDSGLDVSTAYYKYSTDGGSTWIGWVSTSCTGSDYTTDYETITATSVPFNQDSETKNKIKFKINDMAGNMGYSSVYTVKIEAVVNVPPNASFTYSPTFPTTADTIQFTDTSTDSDGWIGEWFWDFDDGNYSTLQNPTHQYAESGTYTVNLTVADDDGAIDSMLKTMDVEISPSQGLCGDVNNDGVVNVLAATKVKNRAGNPSYPLDNEWAADVNSDGIINVLDATKVKNRAADPNYPW
ncbi:MAG: PKD domain-containing protein [Methanocellales archaeon]|nr:PKD domain-containing protein [Methanocellales archaeon]MDD5485740.1 PKD domain-containing protein [Methanocellales archaeon]